MSFTRDIIQGFIDGYITAGGDPSALTDAVGQYMENHPTYKASVEEKTSIQSDVGSYRVSGQDKLAPLAVPTIPVKLGGPTLQ
jgi:hypothetical protein